MKAVTGKPMGVVYLGLNDFPFGLAETQKVTLVARGLIHNGCHVTVLSRWWSMMKWDGHSGASSSGVVEGIAYINASGALYKPDSWSKRKTLRFKGLWVELCTIFKLRKSGRLSVAILSTGSFVNVLYYSLLSHILTFPIVIHLAELYGATLRTPGTGARLNAFLFDRFVFRFVDGVIPISEYLISRIQRFSSRTPWIKDSCLVDMDRFAHIARQPKDKYFLFCGYLGHGEIIRFILQAFEECTSRMDVYLYLVVNGSAGDLTALAKEIGRLEKKNLVKIYSNVCDEELSQLYVNACALLIPLRPTLQDRARFPHKIGEYCASGRPIVTTAYGEILGLFTDGENAYVVPRYEVALFARGLDAVLADPVRADAIGRKGKALAEREFDYLKFGERMTGMLASLL